MTAFRHTPEMPEITYSAAQETIEKYRRIVEKTDATLELLRIDAEALETLIEESITFEEIANNLKAEDVARESHERAMLDVETLVALRGKMRVIREGRAKIEEAIARIEAADAALTERMRGSVGTPNPSTSLN